MKTLVPFISPSVHEATVSRCEDTRNRMTRQIRRLFRFNLGRYVTPQWLHLESKKMLYENIGLYCSLFQPHISYCNELWGNTYASNVNCLCIIQRKVVRLICNADRLAHTNELFKELYILKFPEFVQYKTAILMFHLFHGTLPIHLQNRFSRYSTTRSTRRINTFVVVQARTNITAMCLSVYGVKLWNYLSNNLRDCNSVTIFKKNLKKYLISIY